MTQSLTPLQYSVVVMWKPNFLTTDYRFAETGFLPIIETSLLFETTDERRTGQAYASPMLASLDELHYVFFVITLKDL